jgi:predicted transcriptional regulator
MSENPPLTFAVEDLARILGEPARWHLLRELAKGEPMPVKELARRIGKSPDMTSKHLAFLRDMGVVMTKYGRIYQLVPAIMPAPGATHLDFGHCLVRLDGIG